MLPVKSVTCLTLQQTVFNRPSEASYQDNKIRRNKSKLWVSLPFSSNQSLRVWWSKAVLSGWWEIWGTFKQSELLSTGDRNIFIYISCIAIWRCSTESNWVWHLFFLKGHFKGTFTVLLSPSSTWFPLGVLLTFIHFGATTLLWVAQTEGMRHCFPNHPSLLRLLVSEITSH